MRRERARWTCRRGNRPMLAWDLSALPSARYDLAYDLRRHDAAARISSLSTPQTSPNVPTSSGRSTDSTDRGTTCETRPPQSGDTAVWSLRCSMGDADGRMWKDYYGPKLGDKLLALGDAVDIIAALDAGEDYLGNKRGEFWSAYYSTVDGSGQHFVMRLPDDFDPARTYPLLVFLHGAAIRPMPHRAAVHEAQYIMVQPWARGDSWYIALGEHDVLAVIDYVKKWYRIDDDRVYLDGASMGGFGTWGIASRYPDLFAAAGRPVAARPGAPSRSTARPGLQPARRQGLERCGGQEPPCRQPPANARLSGCVQGIPRGWSPYPRQV